MSTDGTGNQTDQAKEKAASDGGTGTSQEAPTFTQESQVKAVSDALSAAGRATKQLEDRNKDVEKREVQLRKDESEARARRRQADLDAVKDNPEALTKLRTSHDAETRIEEADRREREATEATSKANEAVTKANAARLGAEYTVDPVMLLSITDGSEESMETLAKVLPKMGQEPADTTTEAKRQDPPDSGRNSGVGTKVTREQAGTYTSEGQTHEQMMEMRDSLLNAPRQ